MPPFCPLTSARPLCSALRCTDYRSPAEMCAEGLRSTGTNAAGSKCNPLTRTASRNPAPHVCMHTCSSPFACSIPWPSPVPFPLSSDILPITSSAPVGRGQRGTGIGRAPSSLKKGCALPTLPFGCEGESFEGPVASEGMHCAGCRHCSRDLSSAVALQREAWPPLRPCVRGICPRISLDA
jgi:hypothetical protein